ncbi:unnamed protein product [Discosporangium mesarthrocarpum]
MSSTTPAPLPPLLSVRYGTKPVTVLTFCSCDSNGLIHPLFVLPLARGADAGAATRRRGPSIRQPIWGWDARLVEGTSHRWVGAVVWPQHPPATSGHVLR